MGTERGWPPSCHGNRLAVGSGSWSRMVLTPRLRGGVQMQSQERDLGPGPARSALHPSQGLHPGPSVPSRPLAAPDPPPPALGGQGPVSWLLQTSSVGAGLSPVQGRGPGTAGTKVLHGDLRESHPRLCFKESVFLVSERRGLWNLTYPAFPSPSPYLTPRTALPAMPLTGCCLNRPGLITPPASAVWSPPHPTPRPCSLTWQALPLPSRPAAPAKAHTGFGISN